MENKSLVQIAQQVNQLEVLLLEAQGEITEEIENLLAVKELSLPEKVDGYSHIMKKFDSLEAHYKSQAKMFSDAAKVISNAQARLENNIKFAMATMGVSELAGNDIRFTLKPTTGSLVIDDKELVPVEFKNEVVETVVDTKALKAAITQGQSVPGAHIEPGFSLRTLVNKGQLK